MKKKVDFTVSQIAKLPDDKPVVYTIATEGGRPNYHGVAQGGRVRDRLAEHLPGGKDYVPGAKVSIEQVSRIEEAQQIERARISQDQPRYNKQGK